MGSSIICQGPTLQEGRFHLKFHYRDRRDNHPFNKTMYFFFSGLPPPQCNNLQSQSNGVCKSALFLNYSEKCNFPLSFFLCSKHTFTGASGFSFSRVPPRRNEAAYPPCGCPRPGCFDSNGTHSLFSLSPSSFSGQLLGFTACHTGGLLFNSNKIVLWLLFDSVLKFLLLKMVYFYVYKRWAACMYVCLVPAEDIRGLGSPGNGVTG